jgi:hypothetical protein
MVGNGILLAINTENEEKLIDSLSEMHSCIHMCWNSIKLQRFRLSPQSNYDMTG